MSNGFLSLKLSVGVLRDIMTQILLEFHGLIVSHATSRVIAFLSYVDTIP